MQVCRWTTTDFPPNRKALSASLQLYPCIHIIYVIGSRRSYIPNPKTMTKKDYIALAEAIRLGTDSSNEEFLHKGQFLTTLVQILKRDNPRFDGYRFFDACKTDDQLLAEL